MTLENIPSPQPYLAASTTHRHAWMQKLGTKKKPRIGLVWSGKATHTNDHNRSLALEILLPYLPENYEYVSLQKDVRETDLQALANSDIKHYAQNFKDFADTAALCDLSDLVISVDTSVAHLAAAIGKPTWILLPYVPDWRWMLNRDDSPWYASVKLYRQDESRAWQPVLERIAQDLKTL
jgi:ADP-heptose:LPS heptosyltransferase